MLIGVVTVRRYPPPPKIVAAPQQSRQGIVQTLIATNKRYRNRTAAAETAIHADVSAAGLRGGASCAAACRDSVQKKTSNESEK